MTNELSEFLDRIASGKYDHFIGEIQSALDERKEFLKDEVRRRVKVIFGEDAEIWTKEMRDQALAKSRPPDNSKNLFVRKSERNNPQSPPQPLEPLSELDGTEVEMNKEEQQGPVIGRGGAIIGGMRTIDMN